LSFSEHDKYICTIRSQVRGSADLIITDISKGESRTIPLRWRQLIMLSREAMQALDPWPLSEVQPTHPFSASNGSGASPALEAPSSPSVPDDLSELDSTLR
jgi:hypothetical protein